MNSAPGVIPPNDTILLDIKGWGVWTDKTSLTAYLVHKPCRSTTGINTFQTCMKCKTTIDNESWLMINKLFKYLDL